MSDEPQKRKRRGERDDGRILVTISLGRNENGKIVRKYFYGRTRKEAEAKRDKYLSDKRLGMSSLSDTITVEEWCEKWLDKYKKGIDPVTTGVYKSHIKRLCKRIGYKLVSAISQVDLQDALNEVSGMSESTIDKYHSLITQVFGKAYNNRIIVFDPSTDLKVPKGTKGTHRALERWESDLILNNWQAHRTGLWIMLMLLLGLRRGELIALDWKDINFKTLQANIHQAAAIRNNQSEIKNRTKSIAGMRVLPICDPLFQALSSIPENERTGLICKSSKGKQLSEIGFSRGLEGFNNAMTRILNNEPVNQQGKRNDLDMNDPDPFRRIFSIRSHDLRYTFATALYDANVSVKAAQYYLGHSDVRMTMNLYTQLSKEREKRERSKLTTFLDSWIGIQNPANESIPTEPKLP